LNRRGQDIPFIQELYTDYTPSVNVKRTIETLLFSVPSKTLAGLQEIILTNVSGLSREQRRIKGILGTRPSQSKGRYHPEGKGRPAQIYLFVDNILEDRSGFYLKLPFSKNFLFAEVLFHEIGHHVQYWSKSKLTDKEGFANRQAAELSRKFFRQHYWYLLPFKVPIKVLNWFMKKLRVAEWVAKHGKGGK
jgi:hypothetical protein